MLRRVQPIQGEQDVLMVEMEIKGGIFIVGSAYRSWESLATDTS